MFGTKAPVDELDYTEPAENTVRMPRPPTCQSFPAFVVIVVVLLLVIIKAQKYVEQPAMKSTIKKAMSAAAQIGLWSTSGAPSRHRVTSAKATSSSEAAW
jgi:hypothetical protein